MLLFNQFDHTRRLCKEINTFGNPQEKLGKISKLLLEPNVHAYLYYLET